MCYFFFMIAAQCKEIEKKKCLMNDRHNLFFQLIEPIKKNVMADNYQCFVQGCTNPVVFIPNSPAMPANCNQHLPDQAMNFNGINWEQGMSLPNALRLTEDD